MKSFVLKGKRNSMVIICAVLFSLIVVLPHGIFLYTEGSQFRGVYQSFSDDEVYYQARIAEVVRGNLSIGNPYITEHQSDPFLQPPVAEWIVAGLVVITGFSVPLITLLGDIFFVFFGFLLLFLLLKRITHNRPVSLFYSSVFFTLFVSTFGRPISPQLTVLFLLSGLLLMHHLYTHNERSSFSVKKLSIFMGINTGVTLFISPYYWTTLITLYVCILIGMWLSEKKEHFVKKSFLWFCIAFSPFVLGYGYFVLRASKLLGYVDATLRFGLTNSHWPGSYTNIIFAILAAVLLFCSRVLISKKDFWLASSFVVSIFILNWQNILTRQVLQFSSHYLLITILFVILSLAIIHSSAQTTTRERDSRVTISLFGILLVIIVLLFNQKGELRGLYESVSKQNIPIHLQEKSAVFQWLNANTPKDSVVYTLGGDFDFLIPIYTHNKVYYNVYATLFVMPNEETEDRWLIQNVLNPDVNAQYITSRQRDFWMNRFIDSYHFNENRKKIMSFAQGKEYVPSIQIDQNLILDLVQRYNNYKKDSLKNTLHTYKIDYLLLSHEYTNYAYAKNIIDRSPFIHLISTIGEDSLYVIGP